MACRNACTSYFYLYVLFLSSHAKYQIEITSMCTVHGVSHSYLSLFSVSWLVFVDFSHLPFSSSTSSFFPLSLRLRCSSKAKYSRFWPWTGNRTWRVARIQGDRGSRGRRKEKKEEQLLDTREAEFSKTAGENSKMTDCFLPLALDMDIPSPLSPHPFPLIFWWFSDFPWWAAPIFVTCPFFLFIHFWHPS